MPSTDDIIASLTMKYYNLRIYVNEIGLHAVKPSELEPLSTS
jgi:hypothetical protein